MAPNQICISHLGASVTIRSFLPKELCPLPDLEKDFAACQEMSVPASTTKLMTCEIELREPTSGPNGFSFFSVPWRGRKIQWQFAQGKISRAITFPDQTHVTLFSGNHNEVRIILCSRNAKLIHELTFQYVLSTLGEQLEQLGFVRLHALSWIDQSTNQAYLLLGDSGAGKSTLAAQLQKLGVSVLGDEVCLYRDGRLHSIPLPIALKDCADSKRFRDWQNKKSLIELPHPPQNGIDLKKTFVMVKRPGLGKVVFGQGLPFFISLSKIVLGIGLPQMGEIYVRVGNFRHLLFAAWMRFEKATKILSKNCQPILFDAQDQSRAEQIIERLHPELSWQLQATVEHVQRGPFVQLSELRTAESPKPNFPITTAPP